MKNNANKNIETILKEGQWITDADTKIMNILKKIGYEPQWSSGFYAEEKSYTLDRVSDIIKEFLEHIKDNEIIFNEDGDISNY
jgi:hypothetical protein